MSKKQHVTAAERKFDGSITASVAAIITAVPEGSSPFIVAYPLPESVGANTGLTEKTSITFSIKKWSENPLLPEKGQLVKLSQICRFVKGWRASSACPVKLECSMQ